ncbi:MAG: hypothetical protein ACOCXQ_03940 [Patescibacteria group bacterium]
MKNCSIPGILSSRIPGVLGALVIALSLIWPSSVEAQMFDLFTKDDVTPTLQQQEQTQQQETLEQEEAQPQESTQQDSEATAAATPALQDGQWATAPGSISDTSGIYVTNGTDTVAVRDGKYLYIGGKFTEVSLATGSSELRQHLAAVDVSENDIINWNPAPNEKLYAIATDERHIYVGGEFTEIAGQERQYLAVFDKETRELLDWNPLPNGVVRAIAVDDRYVYIGGDFTRVANEDRNRFAAFSKETGELSDFQADVDGPVNAIVVRGDRIFLGGDFQTVNGEERPFIAGIDRETGEVTAFRTELENPITRLRITDEGIVANGPTTNPNGQPAQFQTVIDPETGEIIRSGVNREGVTTTVTIKVDLDKLGFRIPDLSDVLTFLIRMFFVLAGLVALVFLLLGAFSWITSGGEEEAVKKSRDKITAAIIGVILIVVVLAVITTLEQVVFAERICFGVSCAASIPNLVEPCGEDVGIPCE